MSDVWSTLAEPRRREILRLVWDDEQRAGDLARRFDVSFAAVSQHLGRLREAGLVTVRRQGRERWYRADRSALGPLATYLESLWGGGLQQLKVLAEAEERGAQTEGNDAEQRGKG